ncbi:hypothetical protein GCM10027355_11240 [Haloplanus salinarum]
MPPLSRRALLATMAAGAAGTSAGCSGWIDGSSTNGNTPSELGNHTVFAAEGVTLSRAESLDRTSDPSNADVAVYPADASVDSITDSLQAETATAVVGADAQAALMEACAADGRSYGFARNSWGPETSVVAATPSGDRIDTHLFVGVDVPDDLLWALDDALLTTGPECTLRQNGSEHSERFTEDTQPVSISRIRGVNDVGGFDRWDRVRATKHAGGAGYVVDITGTIFAGPTARHASNYRSDQIRLVTHADGQVESATLGVGGVPVDALHIDDRSKRSDGVVEQAVTPESDAARQSFTACQRAVITTDTVEEQFSYTVNGRFRWRRSGLLDDDLWHYHTPGQAAWYPRW